MHGSAGPLSSPFSQVGANHDADDSLRLQVHLRTTRRFGTGVFKTPSFWGILQPLLLCNWSSYDTMCPKKIKSISSEWSTVVLGISTMHAQIPSAFWPRYSSNGSGWCSMEGHQQNPQFAGAMMTIYFLGWSFPQIYIHIEWFLMDQWRYHLSICFDSGLGYFDEGIQRSQYNRPNFTNLDSIYTLHARILINLWHIASIWKPRKIWRCQWKNAISGYTGAEYNTVKTLYPHACPW